MFWDAFVNVLAIIAIIAVAGFVMVFVGDLLLNIIDSKQGIFFKRKTNKDNNESHNEQHYMSAFEQAELLRLQELYRNKYLNTPNTPVDIIKNEQPNIPAPIQKEEEKAEFEDIFDDDYLKNISKGNPVDYNKAAEEEKLLNEKLSSKIEKEEKNIFVEDENEEEKNFPEEFDEEFEEEENETTENDEIEDEEETDSKEVENDNEEEFEEVSSKPEEVILTKENIFDTVDSISKEVLEYYESEKTKKEVISNYSKELDNYSIDKIDINNLFNDIVDEDEEINDDKNTEIIEEPKSATEPEEENITVESEENNSQEENVEEVKEEPEIIEIEEIPEFDETEEEVEQVNEEESEDISEINENTENTEPETDEEQVESEVEEDQEEIKTEEVVEEIIDEKTIAENKFAQEENLKLKEEIANLQKALLQQKAIEPEIDDNNLQMYTSVEACEAKIAQLEERLKEAKKALKLNDKEYKPLVKVRKNIAKYKEKLRRKEIQVARQKVSLYGVNNYGDIDKDKAEELANDIELLDGLRLSVQDCENVIENSRDRYPALEQTNKILLSTIVNVENDLEEANTVLKKLKENKE